MFSVNDRVNYGTSGVCTVMDIREEKMGGTASDYYVLQPAFQPHAVIYVPVDNEKLTEKMRPVLSEAEIRTLISEMPDITEYWIENDDERNTAFRTALRSGDRRQLIALIKSVYQHQQMLVGTRHHLRSADAALMKEAEQLLYTEIAMVLQIAPEAVLPMLMKELQD